MKKINDFPTVVTMNRFQPSALTLERLLSSSCSLETLWFKSPSVYPPTPPPPRPVPGRPAPVLSATSQPHSIPTSSPIPCHSTRQRGYFSVPLSWQKWEEEENVPQERRLESLSSLPPAQPTSQPTHQPQPQAVSHTFHDAGSPGLSTRSSFSLKCLPP